jgi:diaminohydroxyphosphoribosylaminopyrimidine deaminase/5-amino-6-(5-phosphoribosylamino)uracil reductase
MNNTNQTGYLKQTITLAKQADPRLVRDNPRVGAILVNSRGEIVGKGYHEKWGEAHAEVNAINNAIDAGHNPSTCTLYVSLEPCSHTGKTPPCTSLILEKGIKKVVFASADPNPRVAGMEVLKNAGVEVLHVLVEEALNLNKRFFINHLFNRPFITVKAAITKNGMLADADGNSKWITGTESRKHVHEVLRENVDAILSTAKTVLKDNATLNIRLEGKSKELTTVVLDKNLDLLQNRCLNIHQGRTESKLFLVSSHKQQPAQLPSHVEMVIGNYEAGEFNLAALMEALYRDHKIMSLLVEAGPTLCKSLLNAELVDELVVFTGQKVFPANERYAGIKSEAYPNFRLVQTMNFENDVCNYYSNDSWKELLRK